MPTHIWYWTLAWVSHKCHGLCCIDHSDVLVYKICRLTILCPQDKALIGFYKIKGLTHHRFNTTLAIEWNVEFPWTPIPPTIQPLEDQWNGVLWSPSIRIAYFFFFFTWFKLTKTPISAIHDRAILGDHLYSFNYKEQTLKDINWFTTTSWQFVWYWTWLSSDFLKN